MANHPLYNKLVQAERNRRGMRDFGTGTGKIYEWLGNTVTVGVCVSLLADISLTEEYLVLILTVLALALFPSGFSPR
jgi:hypothetical protein